MRRTTRLLANVKATRFLEPGTPTGLTGVFTAPAPRSTLIYLYSSTLDQLKAFPEHSVYRQSVEALTKQRLQIVTATLPAGYEEWATKAKKLIADNPEVFNTPEGGIDHDKGKHLRQMIDGKVFVTTKVGKVRDDLIEEWDGEEPVSELEGSRTTEERAGQAVLGLQRPGEDVKQIVWDPEPQLDASQISEIENQIGAGLIEEVIQVAEGELQLVNVMRQAEVWSDLEEKPAEDQWSYFARANHMPTTQTPPQK